MLEDNVLVSVILVTEDAEDDDVFNNRGYRSSFGFRKG